MKKLITWLNKGQQKTSLVRENRPVFFLEHAATAISVLASKEITDKLTSIQSDVIKNAKAEDGKIKIQVQVGDELVDRSFKATSDVLEAIKQSEDTAKYIAQRLLKVGRFDKSEHKTEELFQKAQEALAKSIGETYTPPKKARQALQDQVTPTVDTPAAPIEGGPTPDQAAEEAADAIKEQARNKAIDQIKKATNFKNIEIDENLTQQEIESYTKEFLEFWKKNKDKYPQYANHTAKLIKTPVGSLFVLENDRSGTPAKRPSAVQKAPEAPKNIPEGYTLRDDMGLYTPGPGIDIAGTSFPVYNQKGQVVKGLHVDSALKPISVKPGYKLVKEPGNWHAKKETQKTKPAAPQTPKAAPKAPVKPTEVAPEGHAPAPETPAEQVPKKADNSKDIARVRKIAEDARDSALSQPNPITDTPPEPPKAKPTAPKTKTQYTEVVLTNEAQAQKAALEKAAQPKAAPEQPKEQPKAPAKTKEAVTSYISPLGEKLQKLLGNDAEVVSGQDGNTEYAMIQFNHPVPGVVIPRVTVQNINGYTVVEYETKLDSGQYKRSRPKKVSDQLLLKTLKKIEQELLNNTRFANINANGDLEDFDFTAKVSDSSLEGLVDDDAAFESEFDNLKYKTIYTDVLTKHFGIGQDDVPRMMREAIQIGLNSQLQFEDLLAIGKVNYQKPEGNVGEHNNFGDHDFQNRFRELHHKDRNPGEEQEYQNMKTIYLEGMKVVKLFNEDIHQQREALKQTSELKRTVDSLATTEEQPNIGQLFALENISTANFAEALPKDTKYKGLKVGISNTAVVQFLELYKQAGLTEPALADSKLNTRILTALLRANTLKELLQSDAVAKNNDGNLIFTKLPPNFNLATNKDNITYILKNINKENLGTPGDWESDRAAEHKQKVEAIRGATSKDIRVYEQRLAKALKSAELRAQDKAGISQIIFQDPSIALPGEEITQRNAKTQEWVDQAFAETSAEAMADNLLNRQNVEIFDKQGVRTNIQLFTVENGERKFNNENLKSYYNHLLSQGLKTKLNYYTRLNQGDKTVETEYQAALATYGIGEDAPDVLDLPISNDTAELLRLGYASELAVARAAQDLEAAETANAKPSDNPKIKAIQEQLQAAGYPKAKISEIESRIIAALGAHFKDGDLDTIGGGIAIPVGENFAITLGATNKGVGAGLAVHGEIFRTANDGVIIEGGAIGNVDLGSITPQLFTGLKANFEISDTADLVAMLGAHFGTLDGPGLVAALGLSYNEKRFQKVRLQELQKHQGFAAIEAENNPTQKAELIREHQSFKQVADQLHDQDLLALYETYADQLVMQSYQDAEAPILRGAAVGLKVNLAGAVYPVLGIRLRVGDRVIFKPTREGRRQIAKALATNKLEGKLSELEIIKGFESPVEEFQSGELYTDKQGNVGVLDPDERVEESVDTTDKSQFDKFRDALKTHGLDAELLEDGRVALYVDLHDHKNISVFADPNRVKTLHISPDTTNNRLILSGDLRKLTVARETFRYQRRIKEGGASAVDAIYITNGLPEDIKPEQFREQNAAFAEQLWEDNHGTAWQVSEGLNVNGKRNVSEKPLKESDTAFNTPQNFQDRQANKELAASLRERQDSYQKETVRKNFQTEAQAAYEKIAEGLQNGNPRIDDIPALVKAANTQLNTPMNAKEVSEFVQLTQHNYFLQLWKKGSEKAVLKTAERNSIWVRDNVLIPEFQKAATKLGITPEKAAQVAEEIRKQTFEGFKTSLTAAITATGKKNPTGQEILDKITRTSLNPTNTILGVGTGIRKGQEKGGTLQKALATGKDQLLAGTITKHAAESDAAKLIQEVLNPAPTLSLEGLNTPFAKKLAAFAGTGELLEHATYKQVVEYFKNPTEANFTKNQEALKKFVALATEVRAGKTLIAYESTVGSAAYLDCSNLSLFTEDKFSIAATEIDQGAYATAGNEQEVYENKDFVAGGKDVVLGLSAESTDKDKTVPKNPGDRPRIPQDADKDPGNIPSDTPRVNRGSRGAI